MGRTRTPRKRIGANEKKQVEKYLEALKGFRFRWSMKRDGEVRMNDRLMNVLLQTFDVVNRSIPSTKLFGETFRPEFYLRFNGKPLCAMFRN